MFNPVPRIATIPILPGQDCLVIDDALLDPERWVALAAEHCEAFEPSPHNAYPGVELRMPDALSAELDAFFARHIRARLGARRTLRMYSRLSMVTRAPSDLAPRQWLCHRDRMEIEPGRAVAACVLYLFRDPAMGGTSFFRARRSERETAMLVHESGVLPGPEYSAKYGIAPGYMLDSNDWFEHLVTIEPRFNRLIFYDGMLFHGGDIRHPERLVDDPRHGRLTLNGFFTCRAAAR
ncbi:MAG TPA: DUF6445 family protein [Xanthomonadaceae bacterium]|nr:DUF6445 family protein [Xanthomonadaceae bacterium]